MMDRLLRMLKRRQGVYVTDSKTPSNNMQCAENNLSEESKEPLIKCRYIVILLGFASEFFLYSQRTTIGISIVAMVNHSALPEVEETMSQSCIGMIGNASIEDNKKNFANEDGEFLWSPEIQGYILGCSFLSTALAIAPAGQLTHLFGWRNTLVWGLFLSSLFTLLSPFAAWWNVYALIFVQSLRGLVQAGFPSSQSMLISNWCPKSERGISFTFLLCGSCWGAAIGGYVSGLFCKSKFIGGWPLVFFVFGGSGIIVSLFGLSTYENPSVHPTISAAELKHITSNQENVFTKKAPDTPWRKLLTSVPLYALGYANFGQMWAQTLFSTVHPTFLRTVLYYHINQNGIINSLQFALMFLTSLGASLLSTILNNKNYMSTDTAQKFWNSLSCVGYSVCVLGIYFAGCNRSVSAIFSVAALACTGFAYAGSWINCTDLSPTFAGPVTAIAATLGSTSTFILPVVAGLLTEEVQTIEQWNKVFFISIGVVMSSGVVFAVFGSAEVQPWNFVQEGEPKNKDNLEQTT